MGLHPEQDPFEHILRGASSEIEHISCSSSKHPCGILPLSIALGWPVRHLRMRCLQELDPASSRRLLGLPRGAPLGSSFAFECPRCRGPSAYHMACVMSSPSHTRTEAGSREAANNIIGIPATRLLHVLSVYPLPSTPITGKAKVINAPDGAANSVGAASADFGGGSARSSSRMLYDRMRGATFGSPTSFLSCSSTPASKGHPYQHARRHQHAHQYRRISIHLGAFFSIAVVGVATRAIQLQDGPSEKRKIVVPDRGPAIGHNRMYQDK